jgi:hypothetical protein
MPHSRPLPGSLPSHPPTPPCTDLSPPAASALARNSTGPVHLESSSRGGFPSSGEPSSQGSLSLGQIVGPIVGAVAVLAGGGFAWFWFRRRRQSSTDDQSSIREVEFVADHVEGMDDATLVTYTETLTYDGIVTGAAALPSSGAVFTVNPSEGFYHI